MGKNIKTSSGPVLDKPGDLAGLLTSLQEGDVLFIDEIHRLPIVIEEYLYSAMEDFFIDIMIDQGVGARSVRLNVPKFTLIGATTRLGLISQHLYVRAVSTFTDSIITMLKICKELFLDLLEFLAAILTMTLLLK